MRVAAAAGVPMRPGGFLTAPRRCVSSACCEPRGGNWALEPRVPVCTASSRRPIYSSYLLRKKDPPIRGRCVRTTDSQVPAARA